MRSDVVICPSTFPAAANPQVVAADTITHDLALTTVDKTAQDRRMRAAVHRSGRGAPNPSPAVRPGAASAPTGTGCCWGMCAHDID
ncbi:hypothetical protein GCM10023192_80380 [Amycolatopsis samaneae]